MPKVSDDFIAQRNRASKIIMKHVSHAATDCPEKDVSSTCFSLTLADHAVTLIAIDLARTEISHADAENMITMMASKLAKVGIEQFHEARAESKDD